MWGLMMSDRIAQDPRRAALFLLSLMSLGMAASVTDPTFIFNPDLAVLHEALPVWARFTMWGLASLLAMAGAVWPKWDTWAFAAAVVMPFERALGHAWAWGAYLVPGAPGGDRLGWARVLVWGSFAALVVLMARVSRPGEAGD